MKKKKTKKRSVYLRTMFVITLIIGLSTLVFMGIMVWLNNPFVDIKDTSLPNFVGQDYGKLPELYSNFEFIVKETDFNDQYLQGKIYDQAPRAGQKVKMGSRVELFISKGIETLKIEDYQGQPAARIIYELRGKGIETEEKRKNSDSVPAGRIISTEPSIGSTVSGGEKLILYVSEGPERKALSVPDVTGLSKEAAVEILTSSGFTVGAITSEPHRLDENTVIRQSPSPGSLEIAGTTISLVTSEGGMESYYISVPLPTNINREITVRARVGEGDNPAVMYDDFLNPSESPSGVWAPSFSGVPGEVERVRIYIDGWLYMDYYLSYDTGELVVNKDNQNSSHFIS